MHAGCGGASTVAEACEGDGVKGRGQECFGEAGVEGAGGLPSVGGVLDSGERLLVVVGLFERAGVDGGEGGGEAKEEEDQEEGGEAEGPADESAHGGRMDLAAYSCKSSGWSKE